jgi:hypothetical protein
MILPKPGTCSSFWERLGCIIILPRILLSLSVHFTQRRGYGLIYSIHNKDKIFYHFFYYNEKDRCNLLIYNGPHLLMVGVRRLELPASTSRTWRASQLRYTPNYLEELYIRTWRPATDGASPRCKSVRMRISTRMVPWVGFAKIVIYHNHRKIFAQRNCLSG